MSWYRSPGGVYGHADGPGQHTAFTGQGWRPVPDEEATQAVARGLQLTVGGDTGGTFDADAVATAVADEGHAKRVAAARKGARTRAAKRDAAQAETTATETAAGVPPVAPVAPDDGTT